ncbi:MAG: periplasmic heavy metal sensor [Verrucomicrobiota bacterium]|jgi:hypothetical protein
MRHNFNPFGKFQPFSGKLRPGEGRSLVILLGAVTLAAAVFAGACFVSQRACLMTRSADNLSWLRDAFHLSDAEMARVRQLHEGYMPQCAKMCALIAAKKTEVQAALGNGTNVTAGAQKKLTELGELRAQCQAQMLQHFIIVSQAMPPEQGRRYLAEMKKLTLGFHEEIEQSMSAGHEHHQP